MEFVYIYKELPDDLSTNGSVLTDWKDLPEITRVLNDKFSFYGNYSLDGQNADLIKNGSFVKALTENGTWQYFEIFEPKKTLDSVSFNGRFIASMANRNFIDYSFTDNGNGSQIMANLHSSLAFRQKFRYLSDVPTTHQFTAKQVGPIDAIVGSNNGNQNLVGVTGGEFDVDNYDIKLVKQIGADNGYRIDFGVNLESIESEVSEQTVNSLFLVGGVPDNDYDEDKEPLSYKFLEIEGVDDSNRRIAKRENSNCKTLEELKAWGQSLFDVDRIHEPTATHKVNMVALEHTLEYQELYEQFAKLHFGDVAHVYVDKLKIDLRERMVEYVWFPTIGKYKSIVLGSNLSKYTSKTKTETDKLAEKINNRTETLVTNIINATAWITGNSGGHVVFRPEKGPSEILIMDTRDVATAKKVWRWNLNGLGYSDNGINGPFGIAMTSKGEIVADFIKVGTMDAAVFQTSLKNAADDYLKLVGGALEVWNENMRLMQLTKNGMKFWYEGSEVGTMGTLGNPFPDIILPDGQKIEGNSIFVTTNGNNRFIGLSARKGSGIIIGMKQLMMIQDRLDMIVDVAQVTGRLNVKELYVDGVKIDTNGGGTGGGTGGDGSTYSPINISSNITGNANIVAWLKKYTGEYGISEYIGLAYALIMVENGSTDGTDDIMQSSESAGYPGPGYLTGEASVKQGCKHLADVLKSSFAKGVDVWGAMQSYNFGTAYVGWLAGKGGKNTTDLAEQYSRDVVAPSLGNTTGATYSYVNAVSQADGRTYLYLNGGNFHYAAMIRQYVKVTEGGSGDYFMPIAKPITVTSEFGWRTSPITGEQELHNGIDLVNGNPNTPIYAADAGEVVIAGMYEAWYGNYVVIKHAGGLYTGYAHQSSLKVSVGQTVTKGQQIGYMGTTGPSTGEHLHFQFFTNGPWPSTADFINPRTKMKF
ncbi:phage tail spike protein [Enterococcus dispar]|uniref:phage tail spike protein n=1 Tax=Enterococcus dispar TaxID=44009 RepID=UPI0018A0AF8B|nr:phage tail spike protein [Enterococcus dispar]